MLNLKYTSGGRLAMSDPMITVGGVTQHFRSSAASPISLSIARRRSMSRDVALVPDTPYQ
jgi:hypothetical protein